MDSNKSNVNYQKPEHDREYGEPGFVYTQYDRGARKEAEDLSQNSETADDQQADQQPDQNPDQQQDN